MHSFINGELLNKYSQIEKAENYRYFSSITSCIYLWYFPILFKSKAESLEKIIEDFEKNQYTIYNDIQSVEIKDNKRKYISKLTGVKMNNLSSLEVENENELFHEKFSQFFLSLSVLNKPIYIGKSTRYTENISSRIKEHISLRTDFSKSLDGYLTEIKNNLTVSDMIVKVIDIESLRKDQFNKNIPADSDFAFFIEKLLINLYKPKFNIVQ